MLPSTAPFAAHPLSMMRLPISVRPASKNSRCTQNTCTSFGPISTASDRQGYQYRLRKDQQCFPTAAKLEHTPRKVPYATCQKEFPGPWFRIRVSCTTAATEKEEHLYQHGGLYHTGPRPFLDRQDYLAPLVPQTRYPRFHKNCQAHNRMNPSRSSGMRRRNTSAHLKMFGVAKKTEFCKPPITNPLAVIGFQPILRQQQTLCGSERHKLMYIGRISIKRCLNVT